MWYDETGHLSKFKARVCARGDLQRSSEHRSNYSPVVKLTTIRILLAIMTAYGMAHSVTDISNAYLNAPNSDNTKMKLPDAMVLDLPRLINDGYIDTDQQEEIVNVVRTFGRSRGNDTFEVTADLQSRLILQVVKSLYGLTNAGRDWNDELNDKLTNDMGFTRSAADPCLYFRGTGQDLLWIAVFVDDILQISPSETTIKSFRQQLAQHYQVGDDTPDWLLGIRIRHDRKRGVTTLSQQQYIDDLLRKLGMTDLKAAPIPDLTTEHLEVPDPADMALNSDEKFLFQQLTGALLYLALCTRPDIASAVRAVATHSAEPTMRHLNAAKRILRYIKGTKERSLTYTRSQQPNQIIGFCDASWADDRANRRSTTGFIFLLACGPISWKSKQQATVALSSCEAEYIALTHAIQEALHLMQLVLSAHLPLDSYAIPLMEDNQSAIATANNVSITSKTKHFDIKLHFVREVLRKGSIQLQFCPTDKNVADILTKAISRVKFNHLALQALGIKPTDYIVTPTSASVERGVLSPVPLA